MAHAGQGLQSLAAELQAQVDAREDYLAPQGKLVAVVSDEGEVRLRIDGAKSKFGDDFGIKPHAHGQLAAELEIPKRYYDLMLAKRPELLTENLNGWFQHDPSNARKLRTLSGDLRGVLSPKHRSLDNVEFASHILPRLHELEADIISAQLTETRLYIKAVLPKLSDEIPRGLTLGQGRNALDRGTIIAAVTASNSDVGAGSLRFDRGAFTTFCTNLATILSKMRKTHVGRTIESDDTWAILSNEARAADDHAFWLRLRDVAADAFDIESFRKAVAQLRVAADNVIEGELVAVVDKAVEQLALPPATSTGILDFLTKGGDLTQWGLSSAITRVAAQDTSLDYDTVTQLERAGGTVALMARSEFKAIGTAREVVA